MDIVHFISGILPITKDEVGPLIPCLLSLDRITLGFSKISWQRHKNKKIHQTSRKTTKVKHMGRKHFFIGYTFLIRSFNFRTLIIVNSFVASSMILYSWDCTFLYGFVVVLLCTIYIFSTFSSSITHVLCHVLNSIPYFYGISHMLMPYAMFFFYFIDTFFLSFIPYKMVFASFCTVYIPGLCT